MLHTTRSSGRLCTMISTATSRRVARVGVGAAAGILVLATTGLAQNRRVILLQESRDSTRITVSASSEAGVAIDVRVGSRGVVLIPLPTDLRAWSDTAFTILEHAITAPPGAEVKIHAGLLSGVDASKLDLVRVATATGMNDVLTFVGPGGVPAATVPLTDSLAWVFATAVRRAAATQVVLAGDQCAGEVAGEIAKAGRPVTHERGSKSATELFEQLTWKGRASTTTLLYIWSSKTRGCRTEKL